MTTSPHSSEFIAEMKERLETERANILERLQKHSHKEHGDYTANPPEYERHEEVNAMESADQAALEGITEAEETRLREIERALDRIAQGTYGVTADGSTIPEARLRANPAATTTIT